MRSPAALLLVPLYGAALTAAASSNLDSDEMVVFFPTIGFPIEQGNAWDCRVRGWVHEPASDALVAFVRSVVDLQRGLNLTSDEANRALNSARARPFFADNERGKRLVIRLGARNYALPRTGADGHAMGRIRLSAEEVAGLRAGGEGNTVLRYRLALDEDDPREFSGEIHLLSPEGVSVVSDIDDTIRLSAVGHTEWMLRSTFLLPFEPVPGMADLYQEWARTPNVAFHYVSVCPWQLFGPLEDFRRAFGFPAGSYHLQSLRMKRGEVLEYVQSQQSNKLAAINELLLHCPRRQFIFVGDAGQDDPEIYGGLARQHLRRVRRILIRDTIGLPRDHLRYREAFRDLPPGLWILFREPSEIPRILP